MLRNKGILQTIDSLVDFFQCPCNFKTAVGLRTHMYRNHAVITPSADKSHSGVNITCQVMGCSFTSTSVSSLCEHLKWHIRDGKAVKCPFQSCKKIFRVRSSFLSHISRKHSARDICGEDSAVGLDANMSCAADESDNVTFAEIVGTTSAHAEGDVLMTNLALFYLRMQGRKGKFQRKIC